MIELLLERIHRSVAFKKSLCVGDIVAVFKDDDTLPAYARVMDLRRAEPVPDEAEKEYWDVELVFLLVPPVRRTVTLNTEQMGGREKWFLDGREFVFVALDLTSVGRARKPGLKVVK